MAYLRLVGNVAQGAGDQGHVEEREPGMARRPAEVLVAVGVEFCRRTRSVLFKHGQTPALELNSSPSSTP